MKKDDRILVTGHTGLAGSAVVRALNAQGYENVITVDRHEHHYDLRDMNNALWLISSAGCNYVFNCAALVGGINANNKRKGEFFYDNIMIQTNILEASRLCDVKKLMFLGSSCVYPRDCPQPIKEEYLMTSPLEKTNVAYAIAKISGIVMCQSYGAQYGCNFISAMPTNLYGINDNFSVYNSHVIAGMMRRLYEAKLNNAPAVYFWGSGTPLREFIYADDLADALIFLMNNYNDDIPINIGTGEEVAVSELANLIKDIVGYKGTIFWDNEYPDGTPRKVLDCGKIHSIGWTHSTPLAQGLEVTYEWFKENYPNVRL